MRKKIKRKAINLDRNRILIECYRIKVEFSPDGKLRIYAFNLRENGGDVLVEISEPIWQADIITEAGKERHFSIQNPYINPSKRDNNDRKEEENI